MLRIVESCRIPDRNSAQERILSVDALRGFDMFWIIGGEFLLRHLHDWLQWPVTGHAALQMEHVEWVGFRFYDLIMPLFVWLAGVSMPFSYGRRLTQNPVRAGLWPHIIRRVLILWILGMVVQGNLLTYDADQFRLYSNTLQAIAAGYLIASVFVLYMGVRVQLVATALLMLLFWAGMEWISVPGAGAGMYEPLQNLPLYVDQIILGRFRDGTTYTWIYSSLNFGATAMLGVFAGYILRTGASEMKKTLLLFGTGIVLVAAGLLWSLIHPLIKHIWTGSFVLFSGGLCFLLLGLFYCIIDYLKIRKWAFWMIVIGSNAILAYTASHLFDFGHVADVFVGGLKDITGQAFLLIRSTGALVVLYLLLLYLYRKKVFIKV